MLINKYKLLPEQGSIEWLKSRKKSVGGSEMGIISSVNPFSNLQDLIKNKLGIRDFTGNIFTIWGSIMENLIINILQDNLLCKIYETGSLPGSVPFQSYSPDGLAYISSINKIILFEIKCACRRLATGSIPTMYKPQIYTGLDTIQLADYGIFVDAMLRACSIEDWGLSNSTFNKKLHGDKIRKKDKPIALCMIGVYRNKFIPQIKPLDLGNIDNDTLERVLKKVKKNKYKVRYYYQDTKDNIINKYNIFIEQNKCTNIGFLPLKLFRLDMIEVSKNQWRHDNFIKNIGPYETAKTFTQLCSKRIKYVIDTIAEASKLKMFDQLDFISNASYPGIHVSGGNIV